MADFEFNIAKGRVAEFYWRVKNNDPANSALIVVVLAVSGLEAQSVLEDKDTLADVLSGTTNEVTNTNYARITLTDADLAALAPDDTNNRMALDTGNLLWTPGPAAGDNWAQILFCYDSDTTAGNDSNIIPLTAHDFPVTPDGSEIQATVNDFFRAT